MSVSRKKEAETANSQQARRMYQKSVEMWWDGKKDEKYNKPVKRRKNPPACSNETPDGGFLKYPAEILLQFPSQSVKIGAGNINSGRT